MAVWATRPLLSNCRNLGSLSARQVRGAARNPGRRLFHSQTRTVPDVEQIQRSARAVAAGLFTVGTASVAGISLRNFLHAEEQQLHISPEEKRIMEVMLQDAIKTLIEYADAPDEFWESRKVSKGVLAGNDFIVFSKHVAGIKNRLFMGRARLSNVSVEEVVACGQCGPDTRRSRWEITMEKQAFIHAHPTGAFGSVRSDGPAPLLAISRIWTYPALMGLISRRMLDDIGMSFCRVPDEVSRNRLRYAHFGVGVKSALVDDMLQRLPFEGDAVGLVQKLRTHSDASAEAGRIVIKNHLSGVIVEQDGPDVVLNYVMHSDPCGGLPVWASDKGISQALGDIFQNLLRDIAARRKEA
eukprot:TRINITY_DN65221_c0_g1_i1.p1 TRINITY_DN65221_c0_g1~~TRINITY_DN65221_c0_g1_i1.p1  ORF type:complete len:355 (+),score=53.57 TRINITY_DN65221_c0_g1_i1:89-1153(+)